MDSFLAFLMGLKDFIADLFAYIFHELRTDRRRLLQAILGLFVVILIVVGIRTVVSHSRKTAQEAANDPESQMVLPISVPPTPTLAVTPVPTQEATTGSAVVSATAPTGGTASTVSAVPSYTGEGVTTVGNITMVNEYLRKKNGGAQMATPTPAPVSMVQTTADDDVYHEYDDQEEQE